jgi:hypothetical protein
LDPEYAPVSGVPFSYAIVCNSWVVLVADFMLCHTPHAATHSTFRLFVLLRDIALATGLW